MSGVVKAGQLWLNPEHVASMEFDTRHYANAAGATTLVVRMFDGYEHRIQHTPFYLDGVDVYKIADAIAEALKKKVAA